MKVADAFRMDGFPTVFQHRYSSKLIQYCDIQVKWRARLKEMRHKSVLEFCVGKGF
jgi:hypothetical protein